MVKPAGAKVASKVLGPIRCHKCQLKCRDAEHYLNHKCVSRFRPVIDEP
jgi:hypothetical protein